jgi:hypothetical protein
LNSVAAGAAAVGVAVEAALSVAGVSFLPQPTSAAETASVSRTI